MTKFPKFRNLLCVSMALVLLSVISASAEPALLRIQNRMAQNITLTVVSTNSCTQGTQWGAALNVAAGADLLWQVGRNSAVAGCRGEVCFAITPSPGNQDKLCIHIHGEGAITHVPAHELESYEVSPYEFYAHTSVTSKEQVAFNTSGKHWPENWLTIN